MGQSKTLALKAAQFRLKQAEELINKQNEDVIVVQKQLYELRIAFTFALQRLGGKFRISPNQVIPSGEIKIDSDPKNGDTVFYIVERDEKGIPIVGGAKKSIILG
jgi:hypothetical protein